MDEFDLGRWGAHGASYGYMMDRIPELGLLEKRMVVCHLGSGCSVTALVDGKPAYTSMGETPLEGLMSSTRTGSIDPTIGALLGEKLGAAEAIKLMNKQSGLQAMAGSNDMREIIAGAEDDNADAAAAYNLFIDGRNSIITKLEFMGFKIKNDIKLDKSKGYANAAGEGSKPVYIIPTNEAAYMIKKASELLDDVA